MKVILDQPLKPSPVKSWLMLSLSHCGPPQVGLILQMEYRKAGHWSASTTSPCPNLVLKGFGVGASIINRWVVTREPLEHVGLVLLDLPLLDLHQLLQMFALAFQLFSLLLQ